jgi:hypothetical protein
MNDQSIDKLDKLREIVKKAIKGEVPTDFLIDLLKALAYLLNALEEEDENEDDP